MSKESHDTNKEKGCEGFSRRDFLKGAFGFVLNLAVFGLKQEALAQGDIGKESPFSPEVQKEILTAVAKEMKVEFRANVPLPVVVSAESFTDEEFNKAMGFDAGGERNNFFIQPNIILLTNRSKIHNLAHEFTHYFQHNYKGGIIKDDPFDLAENEAVAIQGKFRNYNYKPRR